MKSALRRIAAQARPPVPLAGIRGGAHLFNLGGSLADKETHLRTFRRSGTVFSIVSLLASSAATPEWHLYRKPPQDGRRRYTTGDQGSDQRVEILQHAALSLVRAPNGFHTRFEFFETANQHLELAGETFWVISREGVGFPTAMWTVRPDRMEPVPSVEDYLVGWIYTGPNGEQVPLKLDEVIQERTPDPLDPFRGCGPVAAILPNVEQQRYATEYQRNLFINGAEPGGTIVVPNKMSDQDFDELVDRWREAHLGVARAGRVGVLENGATWIPSAHTNKDLEYGNLRLANRDELREAWRVHKTMMGTADDVNRANAETAEQVFTAWQQIPRLNRRRDTLNNKLLPMFGPTADGVEFDYEDPSPQNRADDAAELASKTTAAKALVDAGYDPDDVLEVVGLPAMGYAPPPSPAVPPSQPGLDNVDQGVKASVRRDAASAVLERLAAAHPMDRIGWALDVAWVGPVEIPLSAVDLTGLDRLFGFGQTEVDAARARAPRPVVLVKDAGPLLHIVDGCVDVAAAHQSGRGVRAFVGTAAGDWSGACDRRHGSLAPSLAALLAEPFVPAGPGPVFNGGKR